MSVALGHRDDRFELTIQDTGAGIDAAFLPHIFDRFRQGAAAGAKRHGGLGLGLAIVRHIVEMHDGTVEVLSEGKDHGSTFVVRLPAVDSNADKVFPLGRQPQEGMADAPRLDGLRLLVVDDEPDARDLIAAVLQERGAVAMAIRGLSSTDH